MKDSLIVSAGPEDAAEAAGWVTRRLIAAGLAEAEAQAVAARLTRAWTELLPDVFPRACRGQLLMLMVDASAGAPAVELVGERRGRISPPILARARRLGILPEPEAGMDGLTRMRVSL